MPVPLSQAVSSFLDRHQRSQIQAQAELKKATARPAQPRNAPVRGDILAPLERARRRVSQLESAGGRAPGALRAARAALAETVDRTIDDVLMRGDPNKLSTIDRDRLAKLRSGTGSSAKDDAEDVLRRFKTSRADVGPMASWLVGSAKVQPPIRSVRVAERLKETLPEEKWAGVRQAVMASLMGTTSNDGKPAEPRDSADDFMKFMHGRGEKLMTTLFSKAERDLMARIGNTVRLQGKQSAPVVKPMLAQLGAMIAPQGVKPHTMTPEEFDKRFAALDTTEMAYPVDDAALIDGLTRRARMINSMEGRPEPLLGEIMVPMPYHP